MFVQLNSLIISLQNQRATGILSDLNWPTFIYCSAMADKKRYKALKSLETKDTKGVHFITAEELKVRNKERKKNQKNPAVKVKTA